MTSGNGFREAPAEGRKIMDRDQEVSATLDRDLVSSPDGTSRRLVVLVEGSLGNEGLVHVRRAIQEIMPDADLFAPSLSTGLFSFDDPLALTCDLINRGDELCRARNYQSIVLVGHCMGGIFIRKLYVTACGENPDALFESEPTDPFIARSLTFALKLRGLVRRIVPSSKPNSNRAQLPKDQKAWAEKIERVVLLAAVNRGWSISEHLSFRHAIFWTLKTWLGNVLAFLHQKSPLILNLRRGAPFIAQLRIQWLSMQRAFRKGRKSVGGAATIQLLGSIDDLVSPVDIVDLATGADFIYLNVPRSGHESVAVMDNSGEGRTRYEIFKEALLSPVGNLKQHSVLPSDLIPMQPDDSVTDVVFIVHGIRDEGYWTQKLAQRVKFLGREKQRNIASVASGYGYFPMLPFLLPWGRRSKVEWLIDQYTEALALYPEAAFSYIGHSNGTYLLARALQDCPCLHFNRVVFAGSVVRREYDWSSMLETGRVRGVLNYVATADWVVACFPKLMQDLRLQDIGSAGHDGFLQSLQTSPSGLQQVYVAGDHGAAIGEPRWDELAEFVLDGTVPPLTNDNHRAWWVVALGKMPILVWALLGAVLVACGWEIANWGAEPSPTNVTARVLGLIAYLWVIRKILTGL